MDAHFDQQLPGLPHISGRTAKAILRYKEKRYDSVLIPPFPSALFDSSGPRLELHYERWTSLRHDYSVPPEAEIDWEHGCARIPEEWSFSLGPNDIDIRDDNGKPMQARLAVPHILAISLTKGVLVLHRLRCQSCTSMMST